MNKRLPGLLLTCALILGLAACHADPVPPTAPVEEPTPIVEPKPVPEPIADEAEPGPFAGKIAIITYEQSQNTEYFTPRPVIAKYGENKIVHVTWPFRLINDPEGTHKEVAKIAEDLEIKAVIVNPAELGINEVFERLLQIRDDIFIIYCAVYIDDTMDEMMQIVDLALGIDWLGMGPTMAQQAHKLGANTFVYYKDERVEARGDIYPARRELIRQTCDELGMEYAELDVPGSIELNWNEMNQFFQDDIPAQVNKYGKDTAFFTTTHIAERAFFEAVITAGAIFPQPCWAELYDTMQDVIDEYSVDSDDVPHWCEGLLSRDKTMALITEGLAQKGMLGRVSCWPVDHAYMHTIVAAEYAVKWLNGEVPEQGVDVDALKQIITDYAGVEAFLTPYTDDYPYTDEGTGKTYENFLLMRVDYKTFE